MKKPVGFVAMLLGSCIFAMAVGGSQLFAQQAKDGSSTDGVGATQRWTIIQVENMAMLLNAEDGTTYVLTRSGTGRYVWRLVPVEHEQAAIKKSVLQQVLDAVSEDWSQLRDAQGKPVGIQLTKGYKDPGVGFKGGDIIKSVDDSIVLLYSDFSILIGNGLEKRGHSTVVVVRDGKEVEIKLKEVPGKTEK